MTGRADELRRERCRWAPRDRHGLFVRRATGTIYRACEYCGGACVGSTCDRCSDLTALDPHRTAALRSLTMTAPTMRDELREAVHPAEGKATR